MRTFTVALVLALLFAVGAFGAEKKKEETRTIWRDSNGKYQINILCRDPEYRKLIKDLINHCNYYLAREIELSEKIDTLKKNGGDPGTGSLPEGRPSRQLRIASGIRLEVLREKLDRYIAIQEEYYTTFVEEKTSAQRLEFVRSMQKMLEDMITWTDKECVVVTSARREAQKRGPGVEGRVTVLLPDGH